MRMRVATIAGIASLGCVGLMSASCAPDSLPQPGPAGLAPVEWERAQAMKFMGDEPPPPETSPGNDKANDPDAQALGLLLFCDTTLAGSVDAHEDPGKQPEASGKSCASGDCHQPNHWYEPENDAALSREAGRDAPSLVNVGYRRWLSWDGRRDSVWSQVLVPMEGGPMRSDRINVVEKVYRDYNDEYVAAFGDFPKGLDWDGELDDDSFDWAAVSSDDFWGRPCVSDPDAPDGVCKPLGEWGRLDGDQKRAINGVFANVGKALEAYLRTLRSGRSRFDLWVEHLQDTDPEEWDEEIDCGEEKWCLTASELRGLDLFVGGAACWKCHSGPQLTDESFHAVGAPKVDLEDKWRGRNFGLRYYMWPDRAPDGVNDFSDNDFRASSDYSDCRNKGFGEVPLKACKDEACMRCRARDFAVAEEDCKSAPDCGVAQFRTAPLRNVTHSAPYMYGGQYATLEEVVRHYLDVAVLPESMAERQLERAWLDAEIEDLRMTDEEKDQAVEDLVAFLKTLESPPPDPTMCPG